MKPEPTGPSRPDSTAQIRANELTAAADQLAALVATSSPGTWLPRDDGIGYYVDGARGCIVARTASSADSALIAALRKAALLVVDVLRAEARKQTSPAADIRSDRHRPPSDSIAASALTTARQILGEPH